MGKGKHLSQPSDKNGGDKNGEVAAKDAKRDSTSSAGPGYITPPDGGWGWMVVFSSFLIHVIADGIVYSFGVFLMEFVDYFNAGRGATSWVGSLQPAVTFTVGPLSSALTNRYGCRPVTIAGAITASAGFILSVFAPNLYYLYVTSGIMAGLGFGLIYLPAIVSVAQYFEARRSFATGLAVCGSGFGTFLLAPITEALVHAYQWQGSMLILGGVILNIVACGIIFRPLDASDVVPTQADSTSSDVSTEKEKLLPSNGDGKTNIADGEASTEVATSLPVSAGPLAAETVTVDDIRLILENKAKSLPGGHGEGVTNEDTTTALPHTVTVPNGKAVTQEAPPAGDAAMTSAVPSELDTSKDVMTELISDPANSPPSAVFDQATPNVVSPKSERIRLNSYDPQMRYNADREVRTLSASQNLMPSRDVNPNPIASLAFSEGALHHSIKSRGENGGTESKSLRHRTNVSRHSESVTPSTLAPLTRKDIFYSGSLYNIPMYRSQPDVYKATVTEHETDTPDAEAEEQSKGSCFNNEFRQTMKEMLSFSLLKNPVFLMFGISNFFTSIGFNMPFIFLPDRAKLAGIDEDRAAWLLSVIGIANTAGRVIFGFLSDRKGVNRLMLYNTALFICGTATAFSPLVGGNYALLVAYAAVFGLFIGVYVSLTSIVLVDLLGLEYLTNSFGLLLLFQGAATFVGPPIAGWMCDWTGSYDISFIVMGTLIALSGAMLYFLPLVQRRYALISPDVPRDIELGKHAVVDTHKTDAEDDSKIIALS